MRWSYSRVSALKFCARSYLFNYYYGEIPDLKVVKTLEKLKNLTNQYLVRGLVVHDAVQFAIESVKRNGNGITLELLLEFAMDVYSRMIAEKTLSEIYYGGEFDTNVLWDKIRLSLAEFYNKRYKFFIDNVETSAGWDVDSRFNYVDLKTPDGKKKIPVVFKMDFFGGGVDGNNYLFDWKFSQKTKGMEQLSLYGTLLILEDMAKKENLVVTVGKFYPVYNEVPVLITPQSIIKDIGFVSDTWEELLEHDKLVREKKFGLFKKNLNGCKICHYREYCFGGSK